MIEWDQQTASCKDTRFWLYARDTSSAETDTNLMFEAGLPGFVNNIRYNTRYPETKHMYLSDVEALELVAGILHALQHKYKGTDEADI